MSNANYGWVDGERVPVSMPAECVWPMMLDEAEGGEESDRAGSWWPSESVRRVSRCGG